MSIQGYGIKLSKEIGGGFLSAWDETHTELLGNLWKYVNEFSSKYLKNPTDSNMEELEKRYGISLSKKIMEAYRTWSQARKDDKILPHGLFNFEEFAISYLNCAKIGTKIWSGDFRDPRYGIATADFTPHITFEPWLVSGDFKIIPADFRYDFDIETKNFKLTHPSLFHKRADENKRAELELKTGKILGHGLY